MPPERTTFPSAPQAAFLLLANGILITAAMHIRGMGYRELVHPSKVSPWSVFIFLVPPILLLIPFAVLLDVSLISFIESVLPISAWEQQAFAAMVRPTVPAFMATCLIAPVVEEMLFRGILLQSFLGRSQAQRTWPTKLDMHSAFLPRLPGQPFDLTGLWI